MVALYEDILFHQFALVDVEKAAPSRRTAKRSAAKF
jgi:hypothetical protein